MVRLDDLLIGDLKIYQDDDVFPLTLDTVLLAHFARFRHDRLYGDLGTGTGALCFIGISLGGRRFVAFEQDEKALSLVAKSIAYNGLEKEITLVPGDYRKAYKTYGGQFDGLLVNPPYFRESTGAISKGEHIWQARHQVETTLEEIFQSAKRLLKFGAYLWLVYRADQVSYALHCLQKEKLIVKRMRFVHSKLHKEAKLVLIEAKYGAKEGLLVEPPLIVYYDDGEYHEEIKGWYEREDCRGKSHNTSTP